MRINMNYKTLVENAGKVKRENIPFVLDSEEFKGFVKRIAGEKYSEKIMAVKKPSVSGMDEYNMYDKDGKILIEATSGVAAATAFNYYLKEICGYTVGPITTCGTLPKDPPPVGKTVENQSRFHYRYFLNYCTFGYTFAFYTWKDWEKVIDWMLLSGYNLVLNTIAMEAVWYNLLISLGYTSEKAKKFLAAPAFMPWLLMGNITNYKGEYPDWWFEERTELAGMFNKRLNAFGAGIMFPGYGGMVPDDFKEHFKNSNPVDQGKWCGLDRPSYILKTDPEFDRVAELFYAAEAKIPGAKNVHYFSVDPFHEGGITNGVDLKDMSRGIYHCMQKFDKNAVWFFQGWGENPKREMLKALDRDHVLVGNLLSESNLNGGDNFADSPFIYCTVNNFGGQRILRGSVKKSLTEPYMALDTDKYPMVGIGLMPEAVETDEIFFDIISKISVNRECPNTDDYLKEYILHRYGKCTDDLFCAWKLLTDKIYDGDTISSKWESPFLSRPSLTADRVSTWGAPAPVEDQSDLKTVVKTLVEHYDEFKESEGFMFDMVDFTRQLLANDTWQYVYGLQDAYKSKDLKLFNEKSNEFLKRFDLMENLLKTNSNFRLGTWLKKAIDLGKNENEKKWLEWNARTIITVWAEKDGDILHDYAAREYQGMISDFYKERWSMYIGRMKDSIINESELCDYPGYDRDVLFTEKTDKYDTKPSGDTISAVKDILNELN